MILKDAVRDIVLSATEGTPLFLVDVKTGADARITVEVDTPAGVTIDECAVLSRAIEEQLDRDNEDYELEVSSPGLTAPFKVPEQYRKNCGRQVNVVTTDGEKLEGVIREVNDDGIVLEVSVKTKKAGQKRPVTELQTMSLSFNEIKSTKVTITFSS